MSGVTVAAGRSVRTQKFQKPKHPKAPVSFRHNFLPPLLGILLSVSVMCALNSQWIVAQAQYHFVKSASSSSYVATTMPAKESVTLSIPAINVSTPVIYDETSFDNGKIQKALEKGVVHYGTTALPGTAGNIVVVGHSSGQPWTPGDYKFVFTLLDKLKPGDRILLDYQGERYTFRVSGSLVVTPDDLQSVQPTTKPQLTLITCTPVGTNKNRLIVTADQVSPDPASMKPLTKEQLRPITSATIPQ